MSKNLKKIIKKLNNDGYIIIKNLISKKQKALLGFNLIPPNDEFTKTTRRSQNLKNPLIIN